MTNFLDKTKQVDWMSILWLVLKFGGILVAVFILYKLASGAGDAISRLFGGGSSSDKKDEPKAVEINIKGGEGPGGPIRTGYTDDIERYAKNLYLIIHKEFGWFDSTTPRCEQYKVVHNRLNDEELKILATGYENAYNERLADVIDTTDAGCVNLVGNLYLDKNYKSLLLNRLKSLG